ncbi:MAG: hypothetical protein ACOVOR_01950 [Rhabdochlamydiaceae bacterium]
MIDSINASNVSNEKTSSSPVVSGVNLKAPPKDFLTGNYIYEAILGVNKLVDAINSSISVTTEMTNKLNNIASDNNELATKAAKEGARVMQQDALNGNSNQQVSVDQQKYTAIAQAFNNIQTSFNGIIQTLTTDTTTQGQNQQMWVQFTQDMMSLLSSLTSLLQSGKL